MLQPVLVYYMYSNNKNVMLMLDERVMYVIYRKLSEKVSNCQMFATG